MSVKRSKSVYHSIQFHDEDASDSLPTPDRSPERTRTDPCSTTGPPPSAPVAIVQPRWPTVTMAPDGDRQPEASTSAASDFPPVSPRPSEDSNEGSGLEADLETAMDLSVARVNGALATYMETGGLGDLEDIAIDLEDIVINTPLVSMTRTNSPGVTPYHQPISPETVAAYMNSATWPPPSHQTEDDAGSIISIHASSSESEAEEGNRKDLTQWDIMASAADNEQLKGRFISAIRGFLLVIGDQATCKNIRGAKRLRQDDANPLEKLAWVKENPGTNFNVLGEFLHHAHSAHLTAALQFAERCSDTQLADKTLQELSKTEETISVSRFVLQSPKGREEDHAIILKRSVNVRDGRMYGVSWSRLRSDTLNCLMAITRGEKDHNPDKRKKTKFDKSLDTFSKIYTTSCTQEERKIPKELQEEDRELDREMHREQLNCLFYGNSWPCLDRVRVLPHPTTTPHSNTAAALEPHPPTAAVWREAYTSVQQQFWNPIPPQQQGCGSSAPRFIPPQQQGGG
ncbi:Hypp9660 [Branchiostoma lanceolatum]|uniref:Hypp9660 protein n=1 Tax=Branchiostoma lanceolatum TaxID=7740 RepID=A0A8S4MNZ1_BRALA|nr:Hypp9660 [Branchiostoma lanceolatum]